MVRQGLKAKIVALAIGISLIGLGVLVYIVIQEQEKNLLRERLHASELMARPILNTIYKDMLEERADMARFLIAGLKTIEGVERVQIIRSNGVEEAFQDYKTLEAVEDEFGEIKDEWIVDHPNALNNVAKGIHDTEFKRAVAEFSKGQKEPVYYIEHEGERSLFTYLIPIIAKPKCSSCHAKEEGARGILMISTSLDEMYELLATGRNKWILHAVVTVAIMTVLLWLLISGVVTRPIDRTVEMLRAIAEGKGDLTRRLDISGTDEMGMLGRWFNTFVEGLQVMVKEIFGLSGGVYTASEKIRASSEEIQKGVQEQLRAAEETSNSIKEMDNSIMTVAEETTALNTSSADVSASATAMATGVEDVRLNIEKLSYSGSSITSSINEISISINSVASHLDELFERTGDVVSSVLEIGERVKEVENYSKAQAEIAEEVRADAEDLGLSSVVKTREGIESVSEEVSATAMAVNRLGERSEEIGKIITVINEIADTTHMLALNATILASQAGEHGKGFAVVARQVKDLATKTTVATKEITGLIGHVQSDVGGAVGFMHRSSERVADGVRLSRNAQEALLKILESTRRSFDMAKLIEKATIDQTKGVVQISHSTQMINTMVEDIKSAADEQSKASEEILKDTVQMKGLIEQVKLTTNGQARDSKDVTGAILQVAEKINTVAEATAEQMMLSKRIINAINTVKHVAEDNAGLATSLEKTVKNMNKQADTLRNTVKSFKT
ncbi:MAG: HAMP domain-containing protein [Proteobacteria bacterium]|nr:HAMP domain-containing protein [Pseudomonadota bacterium]